MQCEGSSWKLVVVLMAMCWLQVHALPGVRLEVGSDVDDEVLIAGVCSA